MTRKPPLPPAGYDFGLSPLDETRAATLHRQSIIFDWLSQHVGGSNIFEHYPAELQAEFRAGVEASANRWTAYRKAAYWPYEMSLQGRSDLVRDWYVASGMTCGTYSVPVHGGDVAQLQEAEAITSRYAALPWLRFVTTTAEIRKAKQDGVTALYGH